MRKPTPPLAAETQALKETYAALNRNDIEAAVGAFDARIAWIEPSDYPLGGTYQGIEAVKAHLAQARATWAEGGCEPERFIVAGNRVLVCLAVRVRLKDEAQWREGRHVAAYTFRGGKAVEMRIFEDRRRALDWAGIRSPGTGVPG